MRTSVAWIATAAVVLSAGCKGATKPGEGVMGDAAPPLLVGPEAASKAPAPVELPAKDTAVLCVRTAKHYEKEGRVEDAIKLYEKARATDPGTAAQAGRRLAVLYDKLGDFSKAAAEYEAQLKLTPNDPELLTDYGYSHYCRGDWASAEAALARAVQLDPKQKRAWVNLGMAQAQLSKLDESFHSFSNAVRPADAHCNVAFVLAAQGKTDEARDRYRQALALDPGQRLAQNALVLLDKPKTPVAKEDGSRARPQGKERFDPAVAASRVPSVAEIEARMKAGASDTPVTIPAPDGK